MQLSCLSIRLAANLTVFLVCCFWCLAASIYPHSTERSKMITLEVACPGLKGPAEARDSGPRFTPGCELALQYDSREYNRNIP